MATERNPFDMIPEEGTNVVPLVEQGEAGASIEIDPEGDGVIVDFSEVTEMEATEHVAEWYAD